MLKIKNKKKKKNSYSDTRGLFAKIELNFSNEKNFFIENLAMLLSSGMTLSNAVDSIAKEIRGKYMRIVLLELAEDVQNGSSLWRAFLRANIFPAHVVSLVRIGEETGRLSENLKLVATQSDKDRAFKSKIKTAMMYPIFIFSVTVIVGVLIMWFILPRLATVFGQLRLELPALTKVLIAVGKFLGEYGAIVIPAFFIFLSALIYFLFFFENTKRAGQYLLFHFPGVGNLLRQIEISRFGYLLGTLLSAGIPVVSALESMSRATTFPEYQKFYDFLREKVSEGNSFDRSFSMYKNSEKLFPRTLQSLLVASEKSGSLSTTLLKVSERYEGRIEDTTKNLSVIFEPILLVIVWVGVVMVALSVILPIYSLIGGLNN